MATKYPTSNKNQETQHNSKNSLICATIIRQWKKHQRNAACISLLALLLLIFLAVCLSGYWRFVLFFSLSIATLLSMAFSTYGTAVRSLSTIEPNRASLFPFALTWCLLFFSTLLLLILTGVYLEEFQQSLRRLGNIIANGKSEDFSFVLTGFSIIITFISGYVLFQLASYKKGFDEEAKKAVSEINQLKSDDVHLQHTLLFGLIVNQTRHSIREKIESSNKYSSKKAITADLLNSLNELIGKIHLALAVDLPLKAESIFLTQNNSQEYYLTQLQTAEDVLSKIIDKEDYIELLATDKITAIFFPYYQLWLDQLNPSRIFTDELKKNSFEQHRTKVNRLISRLLLNPLFTENYETTDIN